MSRSEIPSADELYEQATSLSSLHQDEHDTSQSWGWEKSYQEPLSSFFIWDLEPNRFYADDNIPDEIVVMPNVYGSLVNGTGFSVMSPLEDEEDRENVEQVLGSEMITEFDDEVPKVEEVETPRDIIDMHYVADEADIDIFSLSNTHSQLDRWVDLDKEGPYGEWTDTALLSINSFIDEYTDTIQEDSFSDAASRFSDNGKRTAFIFYATNTPEDRFPEEWIDDINLEYNQGGMAYHTPLTLNWVLEQEDKN